jgi:NAD(P)-dependent dehydrogenase (short-subunit alcohol dehydrogenase family)/acyl carrier protein
VAKVAAAPSRPSTSTSPDLAAIIVAVVAEKTGYPKDMVQLDMDLESDLGIDSIKRVEILSGVQERAPDAPTVEPEHLGRLRTLRQIVDFINSKRSTNGVAHAPADKASKPTNGTQAHAPRPPEPRPVDARTIERSLLVTRDLEPAVETALALAPGHEVWITDDGALAPALAAKLEASGVKARVVPLDPSFLRSVPVAGLVIVAPPRTEWNADSESYLRSAFALTKALGSDLRAAGRKGGALLATVSRLDGAFGLEGAGFDPVMGGLAGLAKTVAQEWPEVRARALDVANDGTDATAFATAIARELAQSGPIEVGLSARKRRGLELANAPLAGPGSNGAGANGSAPAGLAIEAGDVVVITGGARGVTAEVAFALGRAAKATLVLLGRSAAPTPEPAWLAELDSEREIKLALAADLARTDQPATPRAVGERYRRVMAEREVRKNLARIAAHGKVVYRSVDIRDGAATAAVLDEARRTLGPIKALIHGAGVLEDKRIEEKTPEQFDAVVDTKVSGLRSLLEATREDTLRALVLFSSVSGRFGRRGQVDYAMANEVLDKVAQLESRRRKGCRVVGLCWGPWEGGMVTPGLAKEFHKEGVGLIPLEGGAKACLAEMATTGPAEVVLGVDVGGVALSAAPSAPPPRRAATRGLGFAFERDLVLEKHAVLRSHVLGGRPVVPLALTMEWLAHAALHGSPGLQLHGFADLRVLRALAIGEKLARVKVLAGAPERKGEAFEVLVELRSESTDGEVVHARANALLAERLPQAPRFEAPADVASRPYPRSIDEAYESVLFHGDALRGIDEVLGLSAAGIVGHLRAAPAPEAWVSEPWRTAWVTDPLVLDACFQLAILWCREERGALSLPAHVETYRQFRAFPKDGVRATLLHRKNGAHSAVSDIVLTDRQGLVVARLDGYECVVDASLEAAFGAAR